MSAAQPPPAPLPPPCARQPAPRPQLRLPGCTPRWHVPAIGHRRTLRDSGSSQARMQQDEQVQGSRQRVGGRACRRAVKTPQMPPARTRAGMAASTTTARSQPRMKATTCPEGRPGPGGGVSGGSQAGGCQGRAGPCRRRQGRLPRGQGAPPGRESSAPQGRQRQQRAHAHHASHEAGHPLHKGGQAVGQRVLQSTGVLAQRAQQVGGRRCRGGGVKEGYTLLGVGWVVMGRCMVEPACGPAREGRARFSGPPLPPAAPAQAKRPGSATARGWPAAPPPTAGRPPAACLHDGLAAGGAC